MKINYCPECKHQLKVTGTRHTETTTMRRKLCTQCDARSVTIELRYTRFMQLLDAEKRLLELMKLNGWERDTIYNVPTQDHENAAYQTEADREFEAKRGKLRWNK